MCWRTSFVYWTYFNSWIATWLNLTYFSRFSISSSLSNKGDLEDSSTITSMGASFLLFWRISKLFSYLYYPPWTKYLYFWIFFWIFFKYMNLYTLLPSQLPKNKHLVYCSSNVSILSLSTIVYAMHLNIHICIMWGHFPLYISLGYNWGQDSCWTSITYGNYIHHCFHPKWFVELFNMKHVPFHIRDGTICKLHYFISFGHV